MRVLQLCPRVPWPPHDGGRVAMLQVTRGLAAAGVEVEVLSLDPAKHRSDPEAARRALAPASLDIVPIDTGAYARAAAAAVRRRAPWLVARFWSPAFEDLVRRRLAERRFDVVHLESPFLLPYLSAVRAATRAPVALRAQNVEHRIWEQLAAGEPGRLRRAALAGLGRRFGAWEAARAGEVDLLVPISREDEADFRALGVDAPSAVLPCGVDIDAVPPPAEPAAGDPFSVCFVGSMLYLPNREAVDRLAGELWPRIAEREPRLRLTVAGSSFPEELRTRLETAGIATAADVPDLAAFLAPFGAVLAPLRSGSGMRIKVLEAMALGKPVVATAVGARGIELEPGVHALVADEPDAFAAAVVLLARDRRLARAVGAAARRRVEERYDARRLVAGLAERYRELAGAR